MADVFINRFGAMPQKDAGSIVFVHGAGMDSTVWSQQARYLASRGFDVIAPDLPAHGRTEGAPLTTIEQMGDWLVDILRRQTIENCVLVGHSMGSFVALHAARFLSVRNLFLVGSAASMPVHRDLIDAATDDLALAAALIGDWAFASGYDHERQAIPGTSLRIGAIRLLERSAPGVLAHDLQACTRFGTAIEVLKQLNVQKTMIAGAQDRMTPLSAAKKLADEGNAELRVLEGVGHMAPLESPARVRRQLALALASVRRN